MLLVCLDELSPQVEKSEFPSMSHSKESATILFRLYFERYASDSRIYEVVLNDPRGFSTDCQAVNCPSFLSAAMPERVWREAKWPCRR